MSELFSNDTIKRRPYFLRKKLDTIKLAVTGTWYVLIYIYRGLGELGVNLFQFTIETCPTVSRLEQNYNHTRALV